LLIVLVVVNIFLILKIPLLPPPSSLAAAAATMQVWAQSPEPSPPESWAKRRSQMPVQETKSPEITRAAERYLEQYGDPLVMNTYLKITILVLGVVCLMLGALTFKSQKALAGMKPLVIRINDVGHADAIDYRNYEYKPQEAENKYYLSRWANALLPAQPLHHRARPDAGALLPQFGCPAGRHPAGAVEQDDYHLPAGQHAPVCRYQHQERHPRRSTAVALFRAD
jgi:hypothetical protein